MSIALMTLAWKSSLPAGQKMVLLALCDNANDQGECYPSVTMLAAKCSMGARTVQQHIADMEANQIVTREMRTGRSTVYHINPRKFCTPADFAPPQNLHPTPAESAPLPPQISHPTPADFAPITIKEPSIEPSGTRQQKVCKAGSLNVSIPEWLDAGVWQSWVDYRKAIKAPLSPQSAKLCLAKLESLRAEGSDPIEVINNSIMSGKWTGLFPIKQDAGARLGPGRSPMQDVL